LCEVYKFGVAGHIVLTTSSK